MKQIIGQFFKRCAAALLAALLITVLLVPCAAAENQRVLRVAFPQSEGFTMTGPDGQQYGIVVDFLNEIAKYTGWSYEYIDAESNTMLDRFFAGDFDLVGGTYYSDGFEKYFGYPNYNCGYTKLILLARKDDSSIKSYDLDSFNGKTIGVFDRNLENIRRLKEYLATNALDCTLKYYTFEELNVTGDLNRCLESGEVDLLLGNSADAGGEFFVAAAFESQPHYITSQPGDQEILDGLNMALERIYDADANFAKKLYDKHFPHTGSGYLKLTEKEQAYIAQKQTVTVAVPRDWHPMFCLNNTDMHDGLIPDILREVTQTTGLTFTYLYGDNYVDTLRMVEEGEADLLGFFVGTEEDAVQRGLALTASYVELDSILVRNKESSYPSDGLVGGVLEGRKLPSNVAADEVKYYTNVAEALSDVNRGKVDFFYGISSHVENIIQQKNFTNLVQVNLVNNSMDISFAMESPVQPELFTILNKVMNNLTSEQKATINNRNIISLGTSQMTLSSIVYANPGLAIGVVSVFLILVLVAVIVTFRSRLHAALMKGELEKAEADSRAKSMFLSRMSHEIRTPMNAIVGLTELTTMQNDLPEKAAENLGKIKSSARYLLSLISDILDMSRIENGMMKLNCEPFSMRELLKQLADMMSSEAAARNLNFQMEQEIGGDVLEGDAIRLRQVFLNLLSNAFKFTPAGGTVRVRVLETESTPMEAVFTIQVMDTGLGIAPEDQRRIFHSFEQLGSNVAQSQGTGLGLPISRKIVQLMGGELQLKSAPGQGSEFYFTIRLPKGRKLAASHPAQPAGNENALQGSHILLAEDNDLNAEIATELLQVKGAVVTRAENGKLAVEQFRRSAPGLYQAILMDILMPEMNGLEATRVIRALPREDAATIPIIAMTANTFQEDADSALEAGMSGFVPKPVDVTYLYEVLRQALQQGQREI